MPFIQCICWFWPWFAWGLAYKRKWGDLHMTKREKEIAKWEKEKAKPKGSHYLAFLIFVITLIYATDEIASQIGTLMKTEIAWKDY